MPARAAVARSPTTMGTGHTARCASGARSRMETLQHRQRSEDAPMHHAAPGECQQVRCTACRAGPTTPRRGSSPVRTDRRRHANASGPPALRNAPAAPVNARGASRGQPGTARLCFGHDGRTPQELPLADGRNRCRVRPPGEREDAAHRLEGRPQPGPEEHMQGGAARRSQRGSRGTENAAGGSPGTPRLRRSTACAHAHAS